MAQYWALLWEIKPGTEQQVEDLFLNYGRPDHVIKDEQGNEKGRLLSTQVYIKGTTVIRVLEFEGDLRDVAPHMGRQPAIRDLERRLDPYLAHPRDMSTPEGARKFFQESAMKTLVVRRHDQ